MKNSIVKTLNCAVLAAALLLGSGSAARAQTNNIAPTTPADFFAQAGTWISSVDTNKTWTNTPVDLWSGANYQGGLNTSAELGVSYDVWKPSTNTAVAPEVVFRNAGIAGTILSAQGGAGLSVFYYDLKFTGYLDGGYSPALSSAFVEVGARIKKKMTTSTYVGFGTDYDLNFKGHNQTVPGFTAFVGWDF